MNIIGKIMDKLRKIWYNLESNKTATFLTVLGIGAILYFLILLSFTGFRSSKFALTTNEALNHYATAISGLVGTTVTVIGVAFLIYAYRDQQEQARGRKRQAESELFNKLYTDLLDDINSIQYRKCYTENGVISSPDASQLFEGVDALFNYSADDDINPNSVLNHLNLILISFENIIKLIITSPIQDDDYKNIMLDKIHFLFYSKIHWPCKHGIYEKYAEKLLRCGWGNSHILFYKYEFLTKEAYEFLYTRGRLFLSKHDAFLEAGTLKESLNTPTAPDDLGPTLYKILGKAEPYSSAIDRIDLRNYWGKEENIPCPPPHNKLPPPCHPSAHISLSESKIDNFITKHIQDKELSAKLVETARQGYLFKLRRIRYFTKLFIKEFI